jgi:hypothetical protein
MRALVVYESMYGNTHEIADAIAEGLRTTLDDVVVAGLADGEPSLVGVDLVVAGGPTHVHGMSRPRTRQAAAEAAAKSADDLAMEPGAESRGIREWLGSLGEVHRLAAAFDTRIDAPPALTGHASAGIGKRLRKHGCTIVVEPKSFLVDKTSHLLAAERDHAREWGVHVAERAREQAEETSVR